jgi:hypothetical protein
MVADSYTVWFNRRHGLSGHLFGERYKAVLIDEGERWYLGSQAFRWDEEGI